MFALKISLNLHNREINFSFLSNLVRVCNETTPEIGSTKVRVFFFEVGVLGTSFYEISILVTVVHYQSIQLK